MACHLEIPKNMFCCEEHSQCRNIVFLVNLFPWKINGSALLKDP